MKLWLPYLVQLVIVVAKCHISNEAKSKNSLPYFRRQVEEDYDNRNIKPLRSDDSQNHLVSFLVKNVKEIFSDDDEITDFFVSPTSVDKHPEISTRATKVYNNSIEEDPNLADFVRDNTNKSLNPFPFNLEDFETVSPVYEIKQAHKQSHSLRLSKNSLSKSKQKLGHNHTFVKVSALVMEEQSDIPEGIEPGHERSCIFCNNVNSEKCSDPENELIPSIICDREGDLCYSLHTPFGLIDRGCFNAEHNLTTYVCSCNLCNHLPLAEMPFIFSNKQKWARNVIELSRARNLRKSVYKEMACLRCEVNTTVKTGNILKNANCVNGNIGSVPTEVCDPSEVCAIKAIKSEEYVWRGCVRTPLYNYYMRLCNSDLCNYDNIISIYDFA